MCEEYTDGGIVDPNERTVWPVMKGLRGVGDAGRVGPVAGVENDLEVEARGVIGG